VDLVVSPEVYEQFKARGWKEFVHDDGKRLLTRHGYRIMLRWMERDLNDLQQHAHIVQGITLMGLQDLIECKTKLGRKKDLQDVALIKKYLQKTRKSTPKLRINTAKAQSQPTL
jgi:hypothetical protein